MNAIRRTASAAAIAVAVALACGCLKQAPDTFALISPEDGAQGVEYRPTLTWSESTRAKTYSLWLSTAEGVFGDDELLVDDAPWATSYELPEDLLRGRTYWWRVEARNDVGAFCADDSSFRIECTIHRVDASATGANDGSTWADAFTRIQSALQASVSGDDIWVAAGTYYPTDNVYRGTSFTPKRGVAIYGGFAGWETSQDQRDWVTNETILSGDINRTGDLTGNSYRVVTVGADLDFHTILDGFTITMGHNQGFSGGGIFVGGNMILRNLLITGNHSINQGGGVYVTSGGSETRFINCTFYNNTSRMQGAGVSNQRSHPVFIDCWFIENRAEGGGGAGFMSWHGRPVLIGCHFVGNIAEGSGRGGGAGFREESEPLLVNCVFHGNASGHAGGAIENRPASPTIINCTITGNNAGVNLDAAGGGVQTSDSGDLVSNPLIINSIIWGNRAYWRHEIDGRAELLSCHAEGDALFMNAPVFTDRTREAGPDASTVVLDDSTIYAVGDVIEIDCDGIPRTVTGIEDVEILFSPALGAPSAARAYVRNWGPGATDLALDLRLSPSSPCVGGGTNAPYGTGGAAEGVTADIDGNPRIIGRRVDIGAYEHQGD